MGATDFLKLYLLTGIVFFVALAMVGVAPFVLALGVLTGWDGCLLPWDSEAFRLARSPKCGQMGRIEPKPSTNYNTFS